MGVLALLPLLVLSPLTTGTEFCNTARMTADLDSSSMAASARWREEDRADKSLEERARWKSVLPAVSVRSVFSERNSGSNGSGSRFYSEMDSESVLETSREGGIVNMRTASRGVIMLATWDLTPLLFSSAEKAAAVYRRESYVRSRRRSRELLEAVEAARDAIRSVENGAGDPVQFCLEARGAVEQVRFLGLRIDH